MLLLVNVYTKTRVYSPLKMERCRILPQSTIKTSILFETGSVRKVDKNLKQMYMSRHVEI